VHSVLAHTEKRRLIRASAPATDLHRFHYLLRQDVDLRLDESKLYADKFVANLKVAVDSKDIPASTDTGINVLGSADTAQGGSRLPTRPSSRSPANLQRPPQQHRRNPLEQRHRRNPRLGGAPAPTWASSPAATSPRPSFLIQTTHPLWLDWLDDLIVAKDDKADDKLLLSRFAADHPGSTTWAAPGAAAPSSWPMTTAPASWATSPWPTPAPKSTSRARRAAPQAAAPAPPAPILEPIKVVRPVDLVVGSLVTESVTSRFEVAEQQLAATVKAGQAEVTKQLANQTPASKAW
jgi:hypothetical protein